MAMTQFTEAYDFHGRTLVDPDGEKIGTVDEVYSSHEGGPPEWALVHTGLLGTRRSFVPLRGASPGGGDVHVAVDRQAVQDSPSVEADEQLSEAEERRLFEHYGISYAAAGATTAQGAVGPSAPPREREANGDYAAERPGTAEGAAGASARPEEREADGDDAAERPGAAQVAAGRDASGPTTDDAMTRSEEELRVGMQERETGRVRLRKYVVTEHVQQTVPVRREEVRLEREPITDANRDRATAGPEISEAEHEVVLHEEQLVVEKRVVPKERVRLAKDTVTDEQQISEEVRKEQIDVDDAS
jgi:uncharacterized protein (TIGR02271 family)